MINQKILKKEFVNYIDKKFPLDAGNVLWITLTYDTGCKKQIKRIKANEAGTRNSVLYLGILNETKNFLLDTINLLKSHRDFIRSLS